MPRSKARVLRAWGQAGNATQLFARDAVGGARGYPDRGCRVESDSRAGARAGADSGARRGARGCDGNGQRRRGRLLGCSGDSRDCQANAEARPAVHDRLRHGEEAPTEEEESAAGAARPEGKGEEGRLPPGCSTGKAITARRDHERYAPQAGIPLARTEDVFRLARRRESRAIGG